MLDPAVKTVLDSCLLLADLGEARGCSINSLVVNQLINSLSHPFPLTALQPRHAQTGRVSTSSYKIDYVIGIKNFLYPKGIKIPSVVQKLRPFY